VNVRAVLFDFDFTLGDSATRIVHCSRAAFVDMGLTPADAAADPPHDRSHAAGVVPVLTGERSATRAEEYTRRYVGHADRVMTAMTTVYAPAAAVLATMRARGVAPPSSPPSTATASSRSSRTRADGRRGRDRRRRRRDRHKPDPEGLQPALGGLGVDGAHALYVGDHPVDGHAAARAGVRFVRVLTGEDFGDEPWTGIRPLATVADVGELPACSIGWRRNGCGLQAARGGSHAHGRSSSRSASASSLPAAGLRAAGTAARHARKRRACRRSVWRALAQRSRRHRQRAACPAP
jgi:phosphoglycolate phosphatase